MDAGAAAAAYTGIFEDFIGIEHLHAMASSGDLEFFADDLPHHGKNPGPGVGDRGR